MVLNPFQGMVFVQEHDRNYSRLPIRYGHAAPAWHGSRPCRRRQGGGSAMQRLGTTCCLGAEAHLHARLQ